MSNDSDNYSDSDDSDSIEVSSDDGISQGSRKSQHNDDDSDDSDDTNSYCSDDSDSNDSVDSRSHKNKSKNIKAKPKPKVSAAKEKNKKKEINKKLPIREAIKSVDERSLYAKVNRFFRINCTKEQIEKMIQIINKENTVSLRLLNWFAMKYSATMQGLDIVTQDNKNEIFDVRISYRARLKTHSKKYFDPFRRGKRFDYHYNKDDVTKFVETTLCQLNFFKWLFMHDLIDYVDENFDELSKKMAVYEKKKKDTKKKEKTKKSVVKNKKEDVNMKVKKFTEEDNVKLVLTF